MLNELTLKKAVEGLKNKEFSSTEITQACLDRIKSRNERINAFISVNEEGALDAAKEADKKLAEGETGKLLGVPYGAKDVICTGGVVSTGASKILEHYTPPHTATVIKKINENGAILIGKENCDTFGHGASNENSMFGPVRNPVNEEKVAGGSSGGSAAAVADNQTIFSIGEDTGGSIRQPASFCGIAGIRPSYGRNSRYGIMPMASSFDTVGPFAKTVEDLAILMEVMAGQDKLDHTTVSDVVPNYSEEIKKDIKGMRVGIPEEYFSLEGIEEETKKIVLEAIEKLKNLGCEIVPVSLPHTKYAIATYYILVPSEDSSNLGRLDGIRYGSRKDAEDLIKIYKESRSQGFPEEVKRRIMIGTYCLSAGYYDAYYRKAQRVRTLIKQDFTNAFEGVDVIATPTSPFPAFDLGGKINDPLAMYLADVFVGPAAVAGVPGLNVNAGNTAEGLPVGMQLIGRRMGESDILRVGHQFEVAS